MIDLRKKSDKLFTPEDFDKNEVVYYGDIAIVKNTAKGNYEVWCGDELIDTDTDLWAIVKKALS